MPDDPSRGRKPVSSERLDADSRQAAAEAGLEGGQTAEGAGPVAAHDSEP